MGKRYFKKKRYLIYSDFKLLFFCFSFFFFFFNLFLILFFLPKGVCSFREKKLSLLVKTIIVPLKKKTKGYKDFTPEKAFSLFQRGTKTFPFTLLRYNKGNSLYPVPSHGLPRIFARPSPYLRTVFPVPSHGLPRTFARLSPEKARSERKR